MMGGGTKAIAPTMGSPALKLKSFFNIYSADLFETLALNYSANSVEYERIEGAAG